tara:strand:- start:1576 stop:2355 length:780 start_codon:yes stop_codon:yes gene_type:complete
MEPIQNAIIGGTGIYESGLSSKTISVETEFGYVELDIANLKEESIIFLARHGKNHKSPPHLINYRANLKALESLGVKNIFSTFAIGSLNKKIPVGSLVILKDFIDLTNKRSNTFFDGGNKGVKHVKMDDPYCNYLRKLLKEKAKKQRINLSKDSVYVCTEGPRFETKSEIKMMSLIGADVVGMTCVPEIVLAKELGICYASIGFIVNMATGIGNSSVKEHEFKKVIDNQKKNIYKLFLEIFSKKIDKKNCSCSDSIIDL